METLLRELPSPPVESAIVSPSSFSLPPRPGIIPSASQPPVPLAPWLMSLPAFPDLQHIHVQRPLQYRRQLASPALAGAVIPIPGAKRGGRFFFYRTLV